MVLVGCINICSRGNWFVFQGQIKFTYKGGEKEMEDLILLIVRALASSGKEYMHVLLDKLGEIVAGSPNEIDNELFAMVIDAIKTYEVKN